ncbi:apoptosis-inducing factor 1, mitochondrial-like isoform X1 [Montipora foliosa]|uniref:apoptosis-inducing factor 1, mitochondrial-like isoform X1 n=2 Tax=Montipora foliosa TaxID=591990 RepID=UPI0035F1D9A3
MPLVTCSRFLRPCFGRITPALGSFRLSKYRLFHSLEKRSKSAVNRLQASRQASGGSKSSEPASDNALLAIGIGLLGGSLVYGFYSGILYPRGLPTSSSPATSEKDTVTTAAPIASERSSEETEAPVEVVPPAENESESEATKVSNTAEVDVPPPLPEIPEHATYILVGAGTASFAAYRAIRKNDNNAKVLIIGDEDYPPYMRPPLSKELWFCDDDELVSQMKFKQWNGKERGIFFEPETFFCKPGELSTKDTGAVALLKGKKVVGINTKEQKVKLNDGAEIGYDKLLLAPGGIPKNLPIFKESSDDVKKRITLFRKIVDFKDLDQAIKNAQSVVVVGGGFLGSELACALGHRGKKTGMNIAQIFPEDGNMGKVLPKYLTEWTTNKVRKEGVNVIPNSTVEHVSYSNDKVHLRLNHGEELVADHVIVAVGLEPNVELSSDAGLEVDPVLGGFHVNSELEAKSNIWVAGDAACFYDPNLGRRRVEHHDHAVVSGRLAGENMTGARSSYWHQSMFWSDLGPEVGYEAIGLVDSMLPTVGVWAKATKADTPKAVVEATGEGLRSETEGEGDEPSPVPTEPLAPASAETSEEFGKGVVFYMKGKRVVGVLLWNVFNRVPIARKIIKEGQDQDDLNELAKLFDIHKS